MSDAPATDRHDRPRDRVTERLDALEAQARAQLAQIGALRADLDTLSASQADGQRDLAEVRAELRSLSAGQDAVADQVGTVRVELRGLVAQITALSQRVPSGAAVATLGAGGGTLGLGAVLTIGYQIAQALGWIPAH